MPIVFVHGVSNRDGDDYRDTEAGRNGFLREIVGPALGLPTGDLHLTSPYWGGHGVRFAWNMAVVPDPTVKYERFGAADAVGQHVINLVDESHAYGSVVDSARRDFGATVDLVYGAALAAAADEDEGRGLARSYLRAAAYVEANPTPDWLATVTDDNFAGNLNYRARVGASESFGAGRTLDALNEGVSRIANALPAAATQLAGRIKRKNLNATLSRFVGDAFIYLARRGTREAPGRIVQVVLDALRDAAGKRDAHDNMLVVIAHSFGGEIMYDILTRFAPDLEIDYLITVGSQVGLFEEMKLYLASDEAIPSNGSPKVAPPPNLKRWLNVFDRNDVLSYRVSPVFAGAEDYLYESGFSSLHAHSAYFIRPSFYGRLAARLIA